MKKTKQSRVPPKNCVGDLGLQLNGPNKKWKVYKRNKGCNKENHPIHKLDLREGHKACLKTRHNAESRNNSLKYTQSASLKQKTGSGLKEVVGNSKDKKATTSEISASTSRSCEILKEAVNTLEMEKYIGVNFNKQEGTIIGKLINMEERDKGINQRKGSNVGDL